MGLSVCYEAGPGGFALWGLLSSMTVGCDVIAPSLVPVRAGGGKTNRRDAKKLMRLFRAGELTYVQAPPPEPEGLRDLLRCPESRRALARRADASKIPTITAATITTTHAPPAGTLPRAFAIAKAHTEAHKIVASPSFYGASGGWLL